MLDALRGFALFGIIQINLPAFLTGMDPINALLGMPGSWVDRWVYLCNCIFVEAKFYPLFAFLFGYGFWLQWQGLKRRGIAPEPLLLRRYLFLLGLGVLHGTLLFFGDILTMYAAAGMVLMLTTPVLRRLAFQRVLFWFKASVFVLLLQSFAPSPVAPIDSAEALVARVQTSMMLLAEGPYLPAAIERAQSYAMAQLYELVVFLPSLLLFMSLGAFAARVGLLRRPERYRAVWRRCLLVGVFLGVPVNLVYAFCQWRLAADPSASPLLAIAAQVTNQFAVLLTPAYVALWVYASLAARPGGWLAATIAAFARTGRLALTNYLTQSVLMLMLFSNIGLGLAGRLSLSSLAALGLTVCLLQTLVARL